MESLIGLWWKEVRIVEIDVIDCFLYLFTVDCSQLSKLIFLLVFFSSCLFFLPLSTPLLPCSYSSPLNYSPSVPVAPLPPHHHLLLISSSSSSLYPPHLPPPPPSPLSIFHESLFIHDEVYAVTVTLRP